ncbi:CHY zinc finger domain-containing protein [Elsinoe fawcettii]|nr:CHY zinc finger domain-containing protein [Elsinoe fawcettii]
MCKHVLNAQVAIRSPCCRKWFDCAECHAEQETHMLKQTIEMTFACKKCKKAFRKDMNEFEDSDEYCPHCDNHFVIEALEPQARLEVEGEDVRKDARMLKDDRVKGEERQTIWNLKEASERLG